MAQTMAQVRKLQLRREITGALLAAAILLVMFGLGYWFGGLRPRARIAELEAERQTPIYLDTREFAVAGGGTQYVVSGLLEWRVVEIPTYSIEARDRAIGEMRK